MSQDTTNSTSDRVGARPLSAFTTADIVLPEEEESQHHGGAAPIGISPLTNTTAATMLSDEDSATESKQEEEQSSILLSQTDDVFGLLSNPQNTNNATSDATLSIQQQQAQVKNGTVSADLKNDEGDDSSDEEYHSPLEDATETIERNVAIGASPYDYDVNWDMVGHSASSEEQTQVESIANTTSLANAAAASMIATTAAASQSMNNKSPTHEATSPAPIPPQQPFFLSTKCLVFIVVTTLSISTTCSNRRT